MRDCKSSYRLHGGWDYMDVLEHIRKAHWGGREVSK